jgi:hypothetical protein
MSEADSLWSGVWQATLVRAAAGAQFKARSQFCKDGGDATVNGVRVGVKTGV